MEDLTVFLYKREKVLVALLGALDSPVDSQDLQLLLFLFCNRWKCGHSNGSVTATYEFVPSSFGAYSFTIVHDRKRLVSKGILDESFDEWVLTALGKELGNRFCSDDVKLFVREYGSLRGDELVAETYRENPFTAIRSQITDRVLKSDQTTRKRVSETVPQNRDHALFTIGYQQRSLEGFLNVLLKSSVKVLCDVRHNPRSRNYGFSKIILDRACASVGIEYWHLPRLGIEGQFRKNLNDQDSFRKLFAEYQQTTIPKVEQTLNLIRTRIAAGECMALTCYERSPHDCHRLILADSLLSPTDVSQCLSVGSALKPPLASVEVRHL